MLKKIASRIKKLSGTSEYFSSRDYWENRYKQQGDSGAGSYKHLALFKAEILNEIFSQNNISTVIEFGCGDGNQLSLLNCKNYIGLDVSLSAIDRCKKKFGNDKSKSFFLYDHRAFVDNQKIFQQDCSLSLDVLFHLVEKEVYETYLKHLFASARKKVVIYAADQNIKQANKHELYRQFTKDVETNIHGWKLERSVKNKYPAKNYEDQEGSLADFFIYVPL